LAIFNARDVGPLISRFNVVEALRARLLSAPMDPLMHCPPVRWSNPRPKVHRKRMGPEPRHGAQSIQSLEPSRGFERIFLHDVEISSRFIVRNKSVTRNRADHTKQSIASLSSHLNVSPFMVMSSSSCISVAVPVSTFMWRRITRIETVYCLMSLDNLLFCPIFQR
jgi:hypothetical protein